MVLLRSAATDSSAEDFAVAFDYMKRGTIIGEPTAGSSGQPFYFLLPGGGTARVCTVRDRYPDGREFVGIGVQPNVFVRTTIVGIRSHGDEVLDAALNYLRTGGQSEKTRAAYQKALELAPTDPRFDLETRKSLAKDERTKIEQLKS